MSIEPVRLKLREALIQLEALGTVEEVDKFYATVNAFLAAARSILYVAQHEFGWKEANRKGVGAEERAERKKFDKWFASSRVVKAVKAHPLTNERNVVIHGKGQAGFVYLPKPIGGLAIEHGYAFHPAPFLAGGSMSLPLEDKNFFFYQHANGTQVDAVTFCKEYLDVIEQFYKEVQHLPWR